MIKSEHYHNSKWDPQRCKVLNPHNPICYSRFNFEIAYRSENPSSAPSLVHSVSGCEDSERHSDFEKLVRICHKLKWYNCH